MEKPRLYHGSPRKNIEVFEPRLSKGTGEADGPVVFASPDRATSIVFLADVQGPWSLSNFNGVPVAIIAMDREEFVRNDRGGTLYTLPNDTFEPNFGRGQDELEWKSTVSVQPADKEEFPSALEAMVDHGVQVYFVTADEYAAIKASTDHGRTILHSLDSENQRKLANVREF